MLRQSFPRNDKHGCAVSWIVLLQASSLQIALPLARQIATAPPGRICAQDIGRHDPICLKRMTPRLSIT